MLHLVNQVGEEELMDAYGGQYLPYQNELLVKLAENLADEDDQIGLDDAGRWWYIRPSQLRERYDGTRTLNDW